jgi:formylmethanofuran dehydrogenase subunit C
MTTSTGVSRHLSLAYRGPLNGGTGAVIIWEGDVAECRITGLDPLSNPVVR